MALLQEYQNNNLGLQCNETKHRLILLKWLTILTLVIPGKPQFIRSFANTTVLSVNRKYSQISGSRSNPNRNNDGQSIGDGNSEIGITSRLNLS